MSLAKPQCLLPRRPGAKPARANSQKLIANRFASNFPKSNRARSRRNRGRRKSPQRPRSSPHTRSCEVQPIGPAGRILQKTRFCAEVVWRLGVAYSGFLYRSNEERGASANASILDPHRSLLDRLSTLDSRLSTLNLWIYGFLYSPYFWTLRFCHREHREHRGHGGRQSGRLMNGWRMGAAEGGRDKRRG